MLNYQVGESEGKKASKVVMGSWGVGVKTQEVCFGNVNFKIVEERGDQSSQVSLDLAGFSSENSMSYKMLQSWAN